MINKKVVSRIGTMAAIAALALGASVGSASAADVGSVGPNSSNTDAVQCIQVALSAWGGDGVIDADGRYGQQTYQAVMDYQSANHLDADGIVGKDTGTSLWANYLRHMADWHNEYCLSVTPTH
ncbi:peptidoglycan-binding domain-containing protein [Kitasatospora sp. NPDC004669]|uniref:peptidoglycan-binding domain-containing protein n=1 Tax=Kitasatospora sp. NPDC004669 TaxID=3154555 RepID=UPI0033A8FBBB